MSKSRHEQQPEGPNPAGRVPKTLSRAPQPLASFYTIGQVAEALGVSTRTIRRWIANGPLIAHRMNGVVRISEADFQAFLAAHRDH
jgi:excisionase family DNA binding protein